MSHKLLFCNHCGERKPRLTPERAENYFLYCSQECKDTHEAEALARRLESMKLHDPAVRRPKTEGELRAMGISIHARPKPEAGSAAPKPVTRKKAMRRCGKCGETGHNARTCGRKRRSVPEAKPKATASGQKANLTAPKPIGQRPKKPRVCSKCKKPGHNARTCGRRK